MDQHRADFGDLPGEHERQAAQRADVFLDFAETRVDQLGDVYRALPSTADDVRRYAQRVFDPMPDLPELPPQRTLGMVRSDQAREIEAKLASRLTLPLPRRVRANR